MKRPPPLWLLAILPFLFLALVELGLRAAGVARPPRYWIEMRAGNRVFLRPNPDVGSRFFPPSVGAVIPVPSTQVLTARKEPGTRRVLAIGESTTAGFPFPVHGGFPALLEQALNERDPSARTEVVNCGLTGISSATVAALIDEILEARPDELVVYLGHNEFYGAGGVVEGRNGFAQLRSLRIVRLLETIRKRAPEQKPGTLMERLSRHARVPLASKLRRDAAARFARNLETILVAAERAGARVILCEVISNERDLYPFGAPPLPAEGAAAADTTHAGLRYLAGLERLRAGDPRGAGDLRAARELDLVPFRAPAAINVEIRRAAAAHHATLVPLTHLIGEAPGRETFVEHVHPTILGNARIAAAIADAILDRPFTALGRGDAARWIARSDLTACDLAYADGRIAQLCRRWPFTREGAEAAPVPYRPRLVLAEAAEILAGTADSAAARDLTLDEAEEKAVSDLLAKRLNILEAHMRLAQGCLRAGNLTRGARHLGAAARLYPVNDQVWAKLAEVRLALGDRAGAEQAAETALFWNPASPAREIKAKSGVR